MKRWLWQLACCLLASQLEAAALQLKARASVSGPWIMASDVLVGDDAEGLAEVKIKRAAQPGKTTLVSRDLVAMKLKAAGYGGKIAGDASRVSTSLRVIRGSEIQAWAREYLQEQGAKLSSSAKVEIKEGAKAQDVGVPDQDTRLEISSSNRANLRGNVIVKVSLRQTRDGQDVEVGQAVAGFVVQLTRNALIAKRNLSRGEPIDASVAQSESVDVTFEREEPLASLEEAQGLKVKNFIGAGRKISARDLEREKIIKRGDIVRLRVLAGRLSVETQAKALRDAAIGDNLPVETIEGKKQLQGRVLDARTVVSETR